MCVCVYEREREIEIEITCVAEQYLCISQGLTPPRTFLVFWFFLFMLPSATYPSITLSFKAQWQFSWGRPQARLQLVPIGQTSLWSGSDFKAAPFAAQLSRLALGPTGQPGDASSYPLSCGIELGCVAAGPELWALEATKQEIPAPLSFLSLFPASCLCSTEIQKPAPDCTLPSLALQPPVRSCNWVLERQALRMVEWSASWVQVLLCCHIIQTTLWSHSFLL